MKPSMDRFESSYDAYEQENRTGAGCCSAYTLPPMVVMLIAIGALAMAFRPARGAIHNALAASAPAGSISAVFTPEVQHWAAAITTWSSAAALDPNIAATVMQIESCGNPRALSRSGAIGLFQVMPYHFEAFDNPFAPETNAARGLDYLARSLEAASGDARLAFAGYNGGIGLIGRTEWAWPDETIRYTYWGGGIYADASAGAVDSPRLREWLAAGGASLCRSASAQLGLP